MKHILFEQLQNAGYLRHGKPVETAIRQASLSNILDFAQQSCETTSAKDFPRDNKMFSQSASLSLGCSRWPCAGIKCRLERAEQIAHYAALYSDRIYIRNFFSDYIEHHNPKKPPDENIIRREFFEDIQVIAYLKPIIEAGRITPITPPHCCLNCLSKNSLGFKDDKPLRKAMRELTSKIEKNIEVVVQRIRNGPYTLVAEGPEDLLYHGATCLIREEPPYALKNMPRIFDRVQKGDKIHLSRWALHRIGLAKNIANMHYQNIFFELILAQCLGTGFLTDMPIHIELLKNLSQNPVCAERDLAIEKHLTCLVPFAKELNPLEILKLRNEDEDAFILFKASLADAVNEYKKNYGTFSESDAKALYCDVIRPKLCQLEARIQKSRRMLIKGTTRKVLAWTAAISAGLYFGFLPQGLRAAATALGLTKILADLTEYAMTKSDIKESIRDQDMYFLWKIKQKIQSR